MKLNGGLATSLGRVTEILLMCTANRCRSPMAEALLQSALGDTANVSSVGIMEGGVRATENAVAVIAARGLDISEHRSRQLTREIVDDSDLVLCMERMHVREVAVTSPAALPKTFTLKEFLHRGDEAPLKPGQDFAEWVRLLSFGREASAFLKPSSEDDIDDPIGRPRDVYEAKAAELAGYAARVAALLALPAAGR